jgi:hypothetical protein
MTHAGIPVLKEYLYVLRDGAMVVDWGDGNVQDLMTGEFIRLKDSDFGRRMTDRELDLLKARGRVAGYDARTVYLMPLPEGSRKTLD